MSSNDHYIVDYQKFGGIKLYKVHNVINLKAEDIYSEMD